MNNLALYLLEFYKNELIPPRIVYPLRSTAFEILNYLKTLGCIFQILIL